MKFFSPKSKSDAASTTQLELEITGMTCDGCATHVEKALREVKGVVEARVPAWQEKKAFVTAGGEVAAKKLTEAVEAAGYQARVIGTGRAEQAPSVSASAGTVDFDLVVIGTGGGGVAGSQCRVRGPWEAHLRCLCQCPGVAHVHGRAGTHRPLGRQI